MLRYILWTQSMYKIELFFMILTVANPLFHGYFGFSFIRSGAQNDRSDETFQIIIQITLLCG